MEPEWMRANRFFDELERVYRIIPDEFKLEPPDGGDVKSYEAIAKMVDHIEQLRKALGQIIIHCDWPDRVENIARAALKGDEL